MRVTSDFLVPDEVKQRNIVFGINHASRRLHSVREKYSCGNKVNDRKSKRRKLKYETQTSY